jgi:GNAT superfamily N-acetyltransferase
MILLTPHQAALLRERFRPDEPGPLVALHVLSTANGAIFADRWPEPRATLAETPGTYALGGDPAGFDAAALRSRIAGYVDAPARFEPLLREAFPKLAVWERVIFELSGAPPTPRAAHPVRRLTAADAYHVWGLSPEIGWLARTWGGPAGLAASGCAWGAFAEGRLAALACTCFVGDRFEDLGVATEPSYRGLGLSAACSAALCEDIRARGRTPSWTTSPDNRASIRVAEKLGFASRRRSTLYVCGIDVPPPAARGA